MKYFITRESYLCYSLSHGLPFFSHFFLENTRQNTRKTDSTFTIFFVLFLFVGCDLQYVATPQPNINDLSVGDVNPVLRFAHTTLWFLIIEAAQLLWNWAIWERYVDEPLPQMFRDVSWVFPKK